MNFANIKPILIAVVGLFVFSSVLRSCFCTDTDTVEVPTEGTITTVKEISTDDWKIEDETLVADTSDSRIIAHYLSGQIDTFTLEQARLVQTEGHPGSSGSIVRAAGLGMMGYMMMGRLMSTPPQASAYTNQNSFARSTQNMARMRSTASTVSRPRSGFGGGRSTRSVGG